MSTEGKATGDRKVAERLAAALLVAGKSQAELSRHLGKTRGAVNQYVSGLSAIPAEVAARIADYLSITTDFLLRGRPHTRQEGVLARLIGALSLERIEALLALSKKDRREVLEAFDQAIAAKTGSSATPAPTKRPPKKRA